MHKENSNILVAEILAIILLAILLITSITYFFYGEVGGSSLSRKIELYFHKEYIIPYFSPVIISDDIYSTSGYFSILLPALFSVLIITILLRFGAIVALFLWAMYFLVQPFLKVCLFKLFDFYISVFDVLFTSMTSFLIGVFGLKIYHMYRKKQIDLKMQILSNEVATKGNLVSLISHNLNTPIAKIQALFDIIWQYNESLPVGKDILIKLRREITRTFFCVKAVLIEAKLSSGILDESIMSIDALENEFMPSVVSYLHRIGIGCEFSFIKMCDRSSFVPFNVDIKALEFCLVFMVIVLNIEHNDEVKIEADFELQDESTDWHGFRLVFNIISMNGGFSDEIYNRSQLEDNVSESDFFSKALSVFIYRFLKNYKGKFFLKDGDERGRTAILSICVGQ